MQGSTLGAMDVDLDVLISSHDEYDDLFAHNKDIADSSCQGFDKFTTIDGISDSVRDNNAKLRYEDKNKNEVSNIILLLISSSWSWLCLTLIGVVIGSIAAVLNIVTEYLNHIKTGYCSSNFYLNRNFCCWGEDAAECSDWVSWTSFGVVNYAIFVVFSVGLATTAGILVKKYAPAAAGSGISEIKCIVGGFEMAGFLSFATLVIKAIGLPLAIASGLSVGKEGPSVHYAVAAGSCVSKFFTVKGEGSGRIREYLVASSAAGVAVAFGSPIGGVLFAIEEITSNFKLSILWKAYFCSLVATSVLAFINPFRTGQLVMFEVEYNQSWHFFELPFFAILGIFGGLYGIVICKYNILVVGFRKKFLGNYAIKELLVLSLFTAAFCYFNEFLRLDMTESMEVLFHECGVGVEHRLCNIEGQKLKIFLSLLFATVFRMFLTIISYGSKVPCGIFVPSMAAGATFGRAVGIVVENLRNSHSDNSMFAACASDETCINPGTYAFLGAAAALSGITDLTVTVVVIMFELTGAVRYILPTMIVVGITKIINDKWGKGAIADQMIHFNGLPFIDPKEVHIFNLPTSSATTEKTFAITRDLFTYGQLKEILEQPEKFQDLPVVESEKLPYLVGFIYRPDVERILTNVQSISELSLQSQCSFSQTVSGDIDFSPWVNETPMTVGVKTPLEETMDIFFKVGPRTIFVTDSGILKGLITKKDIIKFERYLEKLEEHEFNIDEIRVLENADQDRFGIGDKAFERIKRIDSAIMARLPQWG